MSINNILMFEKKNEIFELKIFFIIFLGLIYRYIIYFLDDLYYKIYIVLMVIVIFCNMIIYDFMRWIIKVYLILSVIEINIKIIL